MTRTHLLETLLEDPSSSERSDVTYETTWPSGNAAPAQVPNALLGGRFVIQRFLGDGGMGVVYAAQDRVLGQLVAVKMLRTLGERAAERMKWEFRALADVAHPNLVGLHELFCDEGRWFFSMELVVGRPLDEHFRVAPVLDYGAVSQRFTELASGICALHAASKLHRDLKPSNVMVRRDGRVTILDFGLVEDVGVGEDEAAPGEGILGTPAYMAPEQILGHAREASDWYAFGVMLYEVLTRTLPFDGSVQEILAAKCGSARPEPPSRRNPGVPPELDCLCQALLSPEPEERPTPDRIFEALGCARSAPVTTIPRSLEHARFVGRQRELAALRSAYQGCSRGEAHALLLHGSSGIGKTTIVDRFLDELLAQGRSIVLRGRCYERESVPYKAFDGVLDALARHLRRSARSAVEAVALRDAAALQLVFPVFRAVEALGRGLGALPADAQELRQAAFGAVRELLAKLSATQTVVLFIDDLQWADADSVQLAEALLLVEEPPSVLLVGCFREGAHGNGPLVDALTNHASGERRLAVRRLEVEPLDVDELTRVAATWVSNEEVARRAALEAQGNPLFATELARHALGAAEQVTLQSVFRSRVCELPPEARDLLELVVVAGRPSPFSLLRAAAETGEAARADVYATVNYLRLQHLVRTAVTGGEAVVECYHDRIVDAVRAELAEGRGREAHRRMARALEATGRAETQVLASHFLGAGEREPARRYSVLAGDDAGAALAFERAAHWYGVALELDPGAPDADVLRVKLADALAAAGRGAEAAREYMSVARRSRGQEALELRRRAADQLLRSGHFDEGFDALDAVLSEVGLPRYRTTARALPRLVRNRALLRLKGGAARRGGVTSGGLLRVDACRVAANAFTRINFVIGATYAAELLLLAFDAGEPTRIAHGLCLEAMFVATEGIGARQRARELIERARVLGGASEEPTLTAHFELASGCVDLLTGQWAESLRTLERAERLLRDRCVGVAWELGFARTLWIPAVQLHRSFDEPTPRIEEWLREARRSQNREVMRQLLVCRAYSFLALDQPEEAGRTIAEGLSVWRPQELDTTGGYALFAETSRLHYVAAGRSDIERHLRRFRSFFASPLSRCQFIRAHAVFYAAISEQVLATFPGAPSTLRRSALRRARRLAGEGVDYAAGFARIVLAQEACLAGDLPAALRFVSEAAESAHRSQQFIVESSCRYFQGVLLGGRAGEARRVEATRDLFERGCVRPERIAAAYCPVLDRCLNEAPARPSRPA